MNSDYPAPLLPEPGLTIGHKSTFQAPRHDDFVPTEFLLGTLLGFAFPTGRPTTGKSSKERRPSHDPNQ